MLTGVIGQDGTYLAAFLLSKGYEAHRIVRRASVFNTDRIDDLYHAPHTCGINFTLHYGDLADGSSLRHILEQVSPEEVYNLGAQSHVKVSFDIPEYTADVDAVGTLRLLEALRDHVRHGGQRVRYYQAGSCAVGTGGGLVRAAAAGRRVHRRRYGESILANDTRPAHDNARLRRT